MQELALLLGIVIAEWVIIYPRMGDSSGYFWLALRRTSVFLVAAIALRFAIGWVLLSLSQLGKFELSYTWPWAAVIGVIAVLLPSSLELFLDRNATTKFVGSTLVQLLLRLNLLVGQNIRKIIQKCKEQDNYDCQNSRGWWNLGLTRQQVNRRLRILYEGCKLDIACERREPELLRHDVDIAAGQKFYLIVAHLGRKQLKRVLGEPPCPPPPGLNWDGSERRRK